MSLRTSTASTGHDPRSWPVLVLLVAVVLVPSAYVFWVMRRTIDSERLAARQTLSSAYASQLAAIQRTVDVAWEERVRGLEEIARSGSPAEAFAALVRSGLADSAVLLEGEHAAYPAPSGAAPSELLEKSGEWGRAEQLERTAPGDAATVYASLALSEKEPLAAARALQGEARCLVSASRVDEAIAVLLGPVQQRLAGGGGEARGMAASARLRALELIGDPAAPAFRQAASELASELSRYDGPDPIAAAKRLFLMKRLAELWPQVRFDTLAAEELAARAAEAGLAPATELALAPSGTAGVWQLACAGGRVRALYGEETLVALARQAAAGLRLADGAAVDLVAPGRGSGQVFVELPAGRVLPGWQVALRFDQADRLESEADEKVTAYVASGVLVIGGVLVLAGFLVRAVRRQIRLTRLKGDLLATVSHELKTPLASTRLLVETLLDAERLDERRVREYLELIAKENQRLSRLIESFLTFSRLEQKKLAFERAEVDPAGVVRAAVEACAERFQRPGARLAVEVAPDLPRVVGDKDALVTVLVNLLDNAWKYTGDEKRVELRVRRENGSVAFAVADDGIGLSRRDQSRVFGRFFQVDQRLARKGSGVGLGLSIVDSIVRAHGGEVEVESELGRGSTFTVRLPAWREGRRLRKAAL